jgi:predicted kinase
VTTRVLHVMSGPCGSGKSTRARMLSMAGYQVLAADDVRLSNPGWSPEQIMFALCSAAYTFFRHGVRLVCIDACNMHEHDRVRWETVALVADADFVFDRMTTPLEQCLEWDARRGDPVGAERIRAQFA